MMNDTEVKEKLYSEVYGEISKDDLKKLFESYFKTQILNVLDDIGWMLFFQNVYFDKNDESKDVKDKLYDDAIKILKEFLPFIDKYAIGEHFNAFLVACAFVLGILYDNNLRDEVFKAYLELGQVFKNKLENRDDVAYQ